MPGLSAVQIQGLTTLDEIKSDKTLSFNATSQVLYFAYPASFGALESVVEENDFEILPDFVKTTVAFTLSSPNFNTGVADYFVYEHKNIVTISDFTITFKF